MTSFRRVATSLKIVTFCTVAGALLALVLQWPYLFPSQPEPQQLPPVPASATTILGIVVGGFYNAVPYVQAVDGNSYHLVFSGEIDEHVWRINDPDSSARPGEQCTPGQEKRITAVAGLIVECQTVQVYGEWCPGPYRSFALAAQGDVWRLDTKLPCSYLLDSGIVLLALAGFAIGLTIATIRKLAMWYWSFRVR
jgi:hypothetical protein